jgi:hypothetical protein
MRQEYQRTIDSFRRIQDFLDVHANELGAQ